jgi:hypothetical protein
MDSENGIQESQNRARIQVLSFIAISSFIALGLRNQSDPALIGHEQNIRR